jgi:hypothetical protein
MALDTAAFPGGQSIAASVRPVHGAKEKDEGLIIVHFTVVSDDPEERLQVTQALRAACEQAKVGNRQLFPIITDQSVTMEVTRAKTLAAFIAPWVCKILSIPTTGLRADV